MLTVGQGVGFYEILEKLGEGAMGIVYRARDKRLDRVVALKVLHAHQPYDVYHQRRLAHEARAASALNHPNIVTIYDIHVEGALCFIAMECVPGKTLHEVIPRKGMRVPEALNLAIQIADALGAAATGGVVHRDLKPTNVMVTETGVVKILDFGLAKLTNTRVCDHTRSMTLDDWSLPTSAGLVVGTAGYMSPEQLEGKPLDSRSDIFSFGAVLYEMLTGQRAFRGESVISILSAVLRDHPPPVTQIARNIPSDVEKIVSRCLRKDPDRRFHSFGDVRVALLEGKEALELGAEQAFLKRLLKQNLVWVLGFVAVLVLMAGGVAYRLSRSSTAGPPSEVVPFTNFAGFQGYPAFSPNGEEIAFAWTGGTGATTHIWLKMIGTEQTLSLTQGNLSDSHPAWSPDGRSIAFIRDLSPATSAIYITSRFGGSERYLASFGTGLFPTLDWSHDGKWLVTSGMGGSGDTVSHVLAISATAGDVRSVSFGGTEDEFSPALSWDNHSLAFTRAIGESNWAIMLVPVGPELQPLSPPRRLETPLGTNRQIAWTADQKELIYASGGTGASFLYRIPTSGREPARVLSAAGEMAYQPAVSPSGDRLAYVHDFNTSNIWRVPVSNEGRVKKAVQITYSARSSRIWPNGFSPDGSKIAFESFRSGTRAIWIAEADGSNARMVFGHAGYVSGSPAWSPDAKYLAFDSHRRGRGHIYVISTEGGTAKQLTFSDGDQVVPCWSHDGKWIYFNAVRNHDFQVRKISAAGGQDVSVTRNGGWAPQESPDGKFLFYTRTRSVDTPLLKVPVAGGAEEVVLQSVPERRWAVTKNGVWFVKSLKKDERDRDRWLMESAGTQNASLFFYKFSTRTVISSGALVQNPDSGIAATPDSTGVLYNQTDHRAGEIVLVEHFH